ncbi:transcription initiation factor IIF [Biscogniauxia marginata]|nr:transcription initiation factor IIF [Biscogniauxia marginata]
MASAQQVKAEPTVKPDPEAVGASPSAMSEDDIYEDAGDLEFQDLNPDTNPTAGSVYLTHVPKYLYDAWAHLDDDAEIRIGSVRQWNEMGKDGDMKQHIALLLDHTYAEHQTIPKEYNLEVRDMSLANTFLFTEQDLPGYKSKSQGANSHLPPHLRRKQERPEDKSQQHDGGRRGRYQPRYRKAIPKKTVLAGRFRHELNCHPVWTEETKHIMKIRNDDAMKPKATTTITSTQNPTDVIQAGAHVSNDNFNNFIRNAPEAKKTKKQKEEKASRLSQSELRDRIFQCYEQFNYWSMKAFKQQLNQPEAYLRENLEQLAVLHKTGRFANHWELKPEFKRANVQSVDGAPPDQGLDDSDMDGDDDVEMVNVMPS